MKTFLKILGGVVILFILFFVGLRLYFNDARLKEMILPKARQELGRPVHIDELSISFFRTFPHFGLIADGILLPGEKNDTLAAVRELAVSIKLLPLLSKKVEISKIELDYPYFMYRINKKGATNLDPILKKFQSGTRETSAKTSSGIPIAVNQFKMTGGKFGYFNQADTSVYLLNNVNSTLSLDYGATIQSNIDLDIGGLTAVSGGKNMVSYLPVQIRQHSVIDLNKKVLTLKSGQVSIHGLSMNLSGTVSHWDGKAPMIDLAFESKSNNFGELLNLVPETYSKQLKGFETKGSLQLKGTVKGPVEKGLEPDFNIDLSVNNGYLKNPQLPEPIRNISISLQADNNKVTLQKFSAEAASNTISATGTMDKPLENNAVFNISTKGNIDLGTVEKFYPLKQSGIEDLKGRMNLDVNLNGRRNAFSKASFRGNVKITNASLKYVKAGKPFENINLTANGDENLFHISHFSMQAGGNSMALSGNIWHLLNEKARSFDMNVDVNADLATIKEFYPINEDTLKLRGKLAVKASVNGKSSDPQNVKGNGHISLTGGYVEYKKFGKPLSDIRLESDINNNKILISQASLKTGGNSLSMNGSVINYLGKQPVVDIRVKTGIDLAELDSYYSLKAYMKKITGSMDADLSVNGPPKIPEELKLNGSMSLNGVNVVLDSFPHPIKNLNGRLEATPTSMDLKNLVMSVGSSDFKFNASMKNYMVLLAKNQRLKKPAELDGSYYSHFLDLDQLIINSSSKTSTVSVNLPYVNSSLNARIDSMVIMKVPMSHLYASAATTPKQIVLKQAGVDLFEGKVKGAFTWDIPKPTSTHLDFQGEMDSLRVESFFKQYHILGKASDFYKYVNGKFSAKAQYATDLNSQLSPVIMSTLSEGHFGMRHGTLKKHPVQVEIAKLFNAPELDNITLDDWEATFKIEKGILTLRNFKLTSRDLGIKLEGTQNLVTGKLDFAADIVLPPRFAPKIASVISKDGVEALTQKDKTIIIPLAIKGTSDHPAIGINKKAVQEAIVKYGKNKLKNAVKNKLKSIFGGGN